MAVRMIDAITIGDAFEDLVLSGFNALPQMGEEAYATSLVREIGGGAVITACGLGRLGFKTSIVCSVGAESAWFRSRLAACNVATDLVQSGSSEPTALTVSISTEKDRMYYTYPGANAALSIPELPPSRAVHCAFLPRPDY